MKVTELETKWKEIEELEKELNEFFYGINSSVEQLVFEVNNFHRNISIHEAYEFSFTVKDSKRKFHWANEIVKVYFTVKGDKVETSFNTGAGGWNEYESETLMKVFEEAISMGRHAIHTVKGNTIRIYNILKKRQQTEKDLFVIENDIKSTLWKEKEKELQEKINLKMEDFTPVKNGKELYEKLNENLKSWKNIDLVKVSYDRQIIETYKCIAGVEKWGNTRYHLMAKPVSKKTFLEYDFQNVYYYNNTLNIEEYKAIFKNCTIDNYLEE